MIRKTTAITAVPVFALLLAGTAPVLADQNPAPSVQNEPTGEGNARTDPGVDTDRINDSSWAPRGMSGTFDELDRNRDQRLDQDELNAYGSSAAGSNEADEQERGARNLKFYDSNEDGEVSEDEFRQGLEQAE